MTTVGCIKDTNNIKVPMSLDWSETTMTAEELEIDEELDKFDDSGVKAAATTAKLMVKQGINNACRINITCESVNKDK